MPQCGGRTDERTDAQTMAKTREALHALARKKPFPRSFSIRSTFRLEVCRIEWVLSSQSVVLSHPSHGSPSYFAAFPFALSRAVTMSSHDEQWLLSPQIWNRNRAQLPSLSGLVPLTLEFKFSTHPLFWAFSFL